MKSSVLCLIIFLQCVGCAALNPNSSEDYFTEGVFCFKEKNFNSALTYFKKSFEADNNNIEALFMVSATYWILTDYESAIVYSEQCLKIDKDNADCISVCADSYLSSKQFYSAIEKYKLLISYEPKSTNRMYKDKSSALNFMGLAYGFTGDWSNALSAFSECKNLHVNLPESKKTVKDCNEMYKVSLKEVKKRNR